MSDTKYSVKSGFYDAINHDRLYSADDMNQPYKEILTEGVIVDADGNGFVVAANSASPGMIVFVGPGHALLGGKWVNSDHDQTLTVPANSSIYGRIDSIVLQVNTNTNTRAACLIYRTGTPAGTPAAPDLNNGSPGFYEVRIANIAVAAGAASIVASNITDTRGTEDGPICQLNVGAQQIIASLLTIIEEHPELITAVPDGGITTSKLASQSVTSGKIATNAVTKTKINDGAVETAKIADGAITDEKLDEALTARLAELDDKANIDGYYDGMTVGQAEQVLSNVKETERSPYIFRPSGGSLEIGDREQDTLVGMDLVWNQLVPDGQKDFENTITDTKSYLSLCIRTESPSIVLETKTVSSPSLVAGVCVGQDATGISFLHNGSSANIPIMNNNAVQIIGGHKYMYQLDMTRADPRTVGGLAIKNIMFIDLTATFGSTIADYIYSLETGTAGAGVAWVKRYLTKDYYPYSAPTMQNGVASSHETVGFNQFDVSTSVDGERWYTTGTVASSGTTRSDYIKCLPNTQYYAKNVHGYANMSTVFWFDSDKNYISASSIDGSSPASGIVTSPANACYMGVNMPTTSKDSVCVNMHYDGERDGEYEPYVKHSYPLDDTVDLHGIPKIDASGNLYADGDTYEADGTVTRRYGVVDLGTLDYEWSGNNVFITRATLGAKSRGQAFLCTDYLNSGYVGSGDMGDMTAQLLPDSLGSGSLWVRNTSYSDATAFKTAMSGVKLVYELATPTTESAEPFQTPQIVDNFGTEEYVTSGNVPIGHTTDYPINIKAKVEVAPDAPEADGTYLMQRLNGVNSYIPFVKELPALPSEDGNYLLGLSVSGSGTTKTLSWEVQS